MVGQQPAQILLAAHPRVSITSTLVVIDSLFSQNLSPLGQHPSVWLSSLPPRKGTKWAMWVGEELHGWTRCPDAKYPATGTRRMEPGVQKLPTQFLALSTSME